MLKSEYFDLSNYYDLNTEVTYNRVRSFRVFYGLTQSSLASLVGCSKNTISSIELGSGCSVSLAIRLSTVFNCSVDDLFFNAYDA